MSNTNTDVILSTPSEENLTDAPSSNTQKTVLSTLYLKSNLSGAMFWHGFGLPVIPIAPGSKVTSEKWDSWLENRDSKKVYDFWSTHQKHEVGFIVGDDMIVFDADTAEAIHELYRLEATFFTDPKLIVQTSKGQHHYFLRAAGTIAKSDSHSTEKFPSRIDIKTGRAMAILPPSTGKSVLVNTVTHKDELSEAPQSLIDAIFEHNGRTAPSQATTPPVKISTSEPDAKLLKKLDKLLNNIDPDSGYEDWRNALMVVYHETQGSDDGLELVNLWSSKGAKYEGRIDIDKKWGSFREVANPLTMGTLVMMAKNAGADVAAILNDDAFEVCEVERIYPSTATPEKTTDIFEAGTETSECETVSQNTVEPEKEPKKMNLLDHYSLRGMTEELEKLVVEQKYVLGEIALQGESTMLYAAPNTGKTLLSLHLLIQSIKQGKVDPDAVYYINVDDSCSGLLLKNYLSDEYKFHMLAEGHRNFRSKDFLEMMAKMAESGTVLRPTLNQGNFPALLQVGREVLSQAAM